MSNLENIFSALFGSKSDFNSMPVDAWNSLHDKYSISDYIPYSNYDNESELFHHNDDSIGFCIEVTPRSTCGGSTAVAISEILLKMPKNVFLQVFYYGSKNIENMLQRFQKEHSVRASKGDVNSQGAIDEFINFLRSKTNESISSTMVTKLKTVRLFFSVVGNKNAKKNEIIQFKNDMKNILHSNNFYPETVNVESLFCLGYELLNPNIKPIDYPEYSSSKYINKQMVSTNNTYVVRDDSFEAADSITWINMTPQSISEQFHIWEFSQKLGDYLSESLNANQFNDSFIISATVTKKSNNSMKKVAQNHSIIATQNWGMIFRKHNAVKQESLEILDRIQENQRRAKEPLT